jgi:hypothetical protein
MLYGLMHAHSPEIRFQLRGPSPDLDYLMASSPVPNLRGAQVEPISCPCLPLQPEAA